MIFYYGVLRPIAFFSVILAIVSTQNPAEVDPEPPYGFGTSLNIIRYPIIPTYSSIIPSNNHTASIIFLPDIPGNGPDWANTISQYRQPYMKIICPTVTYFTMVMDAVKKFIFLNVSRYPLEGHAPSIENYNTIRTEMVTEYVHNLIKKEIESGIPPERILIGGYSAGAVLALHAALTFPKKLGGIVALSSWQPIRKTFSIGTFNNVNKNIPIFQANLEHNPDTSNVTQANLYDLLRKHVTKNVVYKTYPDLNAGKEKLSPEECHDLKDFLYNRLQPVA